MRWTEKDEKGVTGRCGWGKGRWANHQRGVHYSRRALKNSDLVDVVKLVSFLGFVFFIFCFKK
jgi:hypothetical protein